MNEIKTEKELVALISNINGNFMIMKREIRSVRREIEEIKDLLEMLNEDL